MSLVAMRGIRLTQWETHHQLIDEAYELVAGVQTVRRDRRDTVRQPDLVSSEVKSTSRARTSKPPTSDQASPPTRRRGGRWRGSGPRRARRRRRHAQRTVLTFDGSVSPRWLGTWVTVRWASRTRSGSAMDASSRRTETGLPCATRMRAESSHSSATTVAFTLGDRIASAIPRTSAPGNWLPHGREQEEHPREDVEEEGLFLLDELHHLCHGAELDLRPIPLVGRREAPRPRPTVPALDEPEAKERRPEPVQRQTVPRAAPRRHLRVVRRFPCREVEGRACLTRDRGPQENPLGRVAPLLAEPVP